MIDFLAAKFRRNAEAYDKACPHLSEAYLDAHMKLLDELRRRPSDPM